MVINFRRIVVGRPALGLGTYGRIRTYRHGGGWKARTLYRDWDGKTRHVERHGKTQGAAQRALSEALRDRARVDSGDAITPETMLSIVAEQWYLALKNEGRSPSTLQAYRDRLDRQVIPAFGSVRIRELTVGLVDRHLSVVKTKHGAAITKQTKSVLSGVCGLACRHDALDSNPCRDVARISTKPKRPPRSLSVEEVKRLRAWLLHDKKAQDRDLPDLVGFMVGTGLRIGEVCGVCWKDIDLEAGVVEVNGTVLRLKGDGLILKLAPKSAAGARTLELPSWCIAMIRERQLKLEPRLRSLDTPVFPAPISGGWRDPSNTRRGLREAFGAAGFDGLTSHVFRKTVATLMDEAGLSARAGADQLGHAKPSMTQDSYFGRKIRKTGAAEVLESLG